VHPKIAQPEGWGFFTLAYTELRPVSMPNAGMNLPGWGYRGGFLSIVCAQRDAQGRVAVTYVRPELTYRAIRYTRPSGIANPGKLSRGHR
jgi:hypothetical protein